MYIYIDVDNLQLSKNGKLQNFMYFIFSSINKVWLICLSHKFVTCKYYNTQMQDISKNMEYIPNY